MNDLSKVSKIMMYARQGLACQGYCFNSVAMQAKVDELAKQKTIHSQKIKVKTRYQCVTGPVS